MNELNRMGQDLGKVELGKSMSLQVARLLPPKCFTPWEPLGKTLGPCLPTVDATGEQRAESQIQSLTDCLYEEW